MLSTHERVSLLRANIHLGRAPAKLMEELAEGAEELIFAKGDVVFSRRDPSIYFYVLINGHVSHPEVQAAEEQFAIAKETTAPGQLFGWGAAVEGMPIRIISARCDEPTRVLAIDGKWFQWRCRAHGEAGLNTLQGLVRAYAGHERNVVGRRGWLSIRNVQKVYDPFGKSVVAVDSCSVEIRPGEFCAIVGPSGCGKSTLLNAVAGFDTITSGEIHLDGQCINSATMKAKPGPDRIVVFQHGALFPWATVLENMIRGPIVQKRMNKEQAVQKARELLARVGLSKVEDRYPAGMSSGMCRRVEIVRALMNDPRVILLDEPFRGLDALTKTVVHNALLEIYEMERKTILFITHDLEEAIYLADRVLVMTTRPGSIKQTIFVDLPRPRPTELLGQSEFLQLKEDAIGAVHEEAVKAFEAGEREMA
jgi:NitT/TauT family transport system ATP-binding protein